MSLTEKVIFIYDGECPFCNKFAELLELKSNLPNIEIKDARKNPRELDEGYDMNIKGALLVNGSQKLSGAEAINAICLRIKEPSDNLLKLLKIIFISDKRSRVIFPFLLFARRLTLFLKRVPAQLKSNKY